jgi:hypothetical protein
MDIAGSGIDDTDLMTPARTADLGRGKTSYPPGRK